MIAVQVRVTKKLMDRLDELVSIGIYSNRSEAIRDAIRKNIYNFQQLGTFTTEEKKIAEMLSSIR